MTCLDTDFIVDLLRRSPDAEKKLENLTSDGDRLNTTPLNASELYKGAYSSSRPLEEAKKVRRLLEIPKDLRVVALLAVGYAKEETGIKSRVIRFLRKRKALSEIASWEVYGHRFDGDK